MAKKFELRVSPGYDGSGFRYYLNYDHYEVAMWRSRPSEKEVKKAAKEYRAELEHAKHLTKGL